MYKDIPQHQWTVEYAPAKYKMFKTKAEAETNAKYLDEIYPSVSHQVYEEYTS